MIQIFNGPPTSATAATIAVYGDLLVDVTNAKLYVNQSKIFGSPTWTQVS